MKDEKKKMCSLDKCTRAKHSKKTKLCRNHHYRLTKHGDVHEDIPIGKRGRSISEMISQSKTPRNKYHCYRCGKNKKSSEFRKKSNHNNLNRCNACIREVKLLNKYGITQKDFNKMLKMQKGKCIICKTGKPGGRDDIFHVDHCHETGKIRGLLCSNCNVNRVGINNKQNLPALVKYIYPNITIKSFKEFIISRKEKA